MEILSFKQPWSFGGKGECGIEIEKDGDSVKVILHAIRENKGISITNAIEHIAARIYNERLKCYPPESVKWIEHWKANKGSYLTKEETYNEVTFGEIIRKEDDCEFRSPKWHPIPSPLRECVTAPAEARNLTSP